jgi:hypothetical protein
VVAEREHVRTGREQLVGELRSDSGAVGDVFAVDDAEAGAELFLQRRKAFLDGRAPRRAEDIRDEENDYGAKAALALPPSARARSPSCGRLK